MLKIVTLNANGLRSCIRKGLREWVMVHQPDVLCIQETKAQLDKLQYEDYAIEGYYVEYADATKAGYSGVAIYSRMLGHKRTDRPWSHFHVESEGRIIVMSFEHFDLINVYLPSGSSGDVRQDIKWALLQEFNVYLRQWRNRACIVVGDFNIAHKNIDLKNWKQNQKNSGFLPYEREWFSDLLADGWVDTLRVLKPDLEQYTWWSHRSNARANNVGWRLDYQLITQNFSDAIENIYVDATKILSDHAPYVVEYSYEKLLYQKLPTH